jgi:hypothetical protein
LEKEKKAKEKLFAAHFVRGLPLRKSKRRPPVTEEK